MKTLVLARWRLLSVVSRRLSGLRGESTSRRGFTLLELLVVIAIIGILAALLLPVLSRSKQKAQGMFCVSNGKQLMVALHLYSDDFQGWLPPNPDYQTTNKMWIAGDMGKPADATNTALLLNPNRSAIAPYVSGSAKVFKCPADQTVHVRTFSMSQAVGTKPGVATAVDGPWLDGTHQHQANKPWRTYGRFSDIIQLSPSDLWVLIDEDPDNISDGAFAVSMAQPTAMLDWPGAYHNQAGGVHFADGHTETHRWKDPRTRPGRRVSKGLHVQTPNNPDILWLQKKTSSKVE